MKEIWAKLERIANAGKSSLRLRPGATDKAIDAAEEKMKLRFPPDLRASIAAHDGQEDADDLFDFLPGCDRLQPLDAVVAQWEEEVKLHDPSEEVFDDDDGLVQTILWSPKRIPIAGNRWWDGANTYCDLVPGPKGTSGQIVTFVSECDLVVLGPSLEGALALYIEALESGFWFDDPRSSTGWAFSQWIKGRTRKSAT
jgi:cell wall assembly regulator SMI1